MIVKMHTSGIRCGMEMYRIFWNLPAPSSSAASYRAPSTPIREAKYIMEPMPTPFQSVTMVRITGQYPAFIYTSTDSIPIPVSIWFSSPVRGLNMA